MACGSASSAVVDAPRLAGLAIAALAIALLAAGCGEPREPIIPRQEAAAELRPMSLHVCAVVDTMTVASMTEPGISHLIEVEVVDGPDDWIGRHISLPYDEWSVGAPPPRVGETVVTSPARWVRSDGTSHGKPATGWARPRPPGR